MSKELKTETLLKLVSEKKTPKEIGEEYGLTPQKVGMLIKKAEFEETKKKVEDEFPIDMFAKEHSGIQTAEMGSSVILTAREYQEYCDANGRYQGRKDGIKTTLTPMELRVNINLIGGNTSGVDVREHLLAKHGITTDELKKVAAKLTKEEEVSYSDILAPLGLKP